MNMEVHKNMHQRRAASKRQKEKAETLQCGHTVCASDQHFPSVSSFHNLSLCHIVKKILLIVEKHM